MHMHAPHAPHARLAALFVVVLAACGLGDDPGQTSAADVTGGSTADPTTGAATEGGPPGCGDGVVGPAEECDDGAGNGPEESCTPVCTRAACGDGFVGPGEGCDDGNVLDGDACTSTCQLPGCGDGMAAPGEGCDDGNADNSDGCLSTCQLASCGDGYVYEGFETCDDGNVDNSDACLNSCQPARCGDGYVREGVEGCDDGNVDNSDACLSNCAPAKCGDGYVYEGVEVCDDGNTIDNDECTNDCDSPSSCSDALLNGTETDVDCGGLHCLGCLDGQVCEKFTDCKSGFCAEGKCVTPKHCRDVRDLGLGDVDGVFLVDADGPGGPLPPTKVFCEMTFEGGGWTAVFNMREKPIGLTPAQQMFDAITKNGPIEPVQPNSNSAAILTQGLVLGDFTEVVFGWAPTVADDVSRYGRLTDPGGLAGTCYLDGFCGPGQDVGEFELVPTGNTRVLQTGKMADFPHVGLGFDDQIIVWGYDRNASHFSNWANWFDEGVCCKAGNTDAINVPGWRYTIYVR